MMKPKSSLNNLLRGPMAALGGARFLAYLGDMSAPLRLGPLALGPLATVFQTVRKTRLLAIPVLLLAACSTPETIPDFRYYRLAPAGAIPVLAGPLLDRPLVLDGFRADGVHGERPILYANDADSLKTSQYHYQLWNDPPPTMVQRRLQEIFGKAGVAAYVTDRLGLRETAFRLQGSVYRFERVLVEGQPQEVVVGIRLRLLADSGAKPYLESDELVRIPVSGDRVEDSAVALSAGIDEIGRRFISALQKRTAHAD